MKIFILVSILMLSLVVSADCQDTKALVGQALSIYGGGEPSGQGTIGGFSVGGLIGGLLFSGIGFVAFVFGKKNTEFRPMLLGIILIVYPYFVKNVLLMCGIGIVLVVTLFVWKE